MTVSRAKSKRTIIRFFPYFVKAPEHKDPTTVPNVPTDVTMKLQLSASFFSHLFMAVKQVRILPHDAHKKPTNL